MGKIINLKEFQKNNPKNKVIEIDFKSKRVKRVQEFRGDKLVKETVKTPFKNQGNGDPNDVA